MAIEGARFRRPVVPGDQMRVTVTKRRSRGPVWKFRGEVHVDDVLCAEADFSAMIMDD
jgi:3-hydroxyacyl-[acyl-carrier-protein] dehydratase